MIIDWWNSASYISAPGTIIFTTSGAAVSVGVYIETVDGILTLIGSVDLSTVMVELGDFVFVLTPAIIDEIISGAKVYIEIADGTVVLVLTGINEHITSLPTTVPKTIRVRVLGRQPAKVGTRGVVY